MLYGSIAVFARSAESEQGWNNEITICASFLNGFEYVIQCSVTSALRRLEAAGDGLDKFLHCADIEVPVVEVSIQFRQLGLNEHSVEVNAIAAQR